MGATGGSARRAEYAPQALKTLGISAVIAKSFARIHYRNLLNLGIPAFTSDTVPDALQDGDTVSFDLAAGTVARGDDVFLLEPPPAFLQEALKEGSILAYYRKHGRFPGEQV